MLKELLKILRISWENDNNGKDCKIMKENKLINALKKANDEWRAIPAFNIFNYISAKGVIDAANEMDTPIIIQTSTGTVKKFGIKQLYSLLNPIMKDSKVDIFLNLDHCTSLEFAKQCSDQGWDMVMFDGSKLPLEENIKQSREIAEYAEKLGVCVEGELGTIAGVEEDIAEDKEEAATFEECVKYLKESKVHIFAPAVGTAHGVYHGIPKLNFELVHQIKEISEVPIVIHGGTGLADTDFKRFIKNGAGKINISTAIKQVYMDSMKEYLDNSISEYKPLDADSYVANAIKEVGKKHIKMFFINE